MTESGLNLASGIARITEGTPYQRSTEWLDFFSAVANSIRIRLNRTNGLNASCAQAGQLQDACAALHEENLTLKPSTRWRITRPLCSLKNILLAHEKKEQ